MCGMGVVVEMGFTYIFAVAVTMAARRKKTPSLPPWATLIYPRFDSNLKGPVPRNPVELVEEESYLRTRSYHALNRQMDLAVADSFQQLSKCVEAQLAEVVDKISPAENEGDEQSPPTKRARTEKQKDADPLCSICPIIDPPERYSPLLLPILIVQGPSYCLDRQEWMKYLVMSTKRKRRRSAVVWLRPSTTGLSVSWQEELTRQCLNQEPDLPAALCKRRKLAKASITEILLTWASHTHAFDDILIYLEVEDSFYGSDLQDFVGWLAERRAIQGLPFVLILLGPHVGCRKIELRSATQGPVGLIVRQCVLPSTKELLDVFWERIWLKQGCPIPFSADTLDLITESFQEQHKSVIQVVIELKKVLAHHFVPQGSFLPATTNKRILPHEQRRVAWFLLNSEARKLIAGSSASRRSLLRWTREMETRGRKACVAMEVLHLLQKQRDSTVPFLLCHRSPASHFDKALDSEKRKDLMALLARLRKLDEPYWRSESLQSELQVDNKALLQLLNELIIFADSCSYPSDMEKCLEPVMNEWMEQVNTYSGTSTTMSSEEAIASISVQPRRHIVAGMIKGSDGIFDFSVSTLLGRMYKLIQDRVSLSQDDWYNGFRADLPPGIGRQESFSLFICGIYYLKLQGLLRERRVPSRGDTVYEKAVLVWCSGD